MATKRTTTKTANATADNADEQAKMRKKAVDTTNRRLAGVQTKLKTVASLANMAPEHIKKEDIDSMKTFVDAEVSKTFDTLYAALAGNKPEKTKNVVNVLQ